jgi:hypothetical protein
MTVVSHLLVYGEFAEKICGSLIQDFTVVAGNHIVLATMDKENRRFDLFDCLRVVKVRRYYAAQERATEGHIIFGEVLYRCVSTLKD